MLFGFSGITKQPPVKGRVFLLIFIMNCALDSSFFSAYFPFLQVYLEKARKKIISGCISYVTKHPLSHAEEGRGLCDFLICELYF